MASVNDASMSNLLVVLLTLHNTFFLAHFHSCQPLLSFSSIFSGNSGISISLCIGHCFIQTSKSHFFFNFALSPGVFHGVLHSWSWDCAPKFMNSCFDSIPQDQIPLISNSCYALLGCGHYLLANSCNSSKYIISFFLIRPRCITATTKSLPE